MDYTIWLQILMELALAVSGEHELKPLLKKATKTFHRKLDCTHICILKEEGLTFEPLFSSPKWVSSDQEFYKLALELSKEAKESDLGYGEIEFKGQFYYALVLERFGTFIMARGQRISVNLLLELEPILEMFATNILGCISLSKQLEVEQELREQKEYNEYFAFHDELTKLPNRRKYLEVLNNSLEKGESGGVLLLDIDNFKAINDTLGHVFGDYVLVHIAKELMKFSDESIFVSRFGGDEFQFLMIDKTKAEIEETVNKIFDKISRMHHINGRNVDITFSIGITLYPEDSNEFTRLLMNADLAMYSIKSSEKSTYRFFDDDLSKNILRKQMIETTLKEAIQNDGFKVVYQPKIDAKTGSVNGYEALLRLKNSPVSPAEFIPIAEENKSIIKIGRIVTKLVIQQLHQWKSQGYQVKQVSINFSAIQIYDYTYFDFIQEEMAYYGIDSSLIEIEITENVFLDSGERTMELLGQFKEAGYTISIDDFGTGYSSLNYLTFLPLDKIKLDRSIIEKFLECDTINVMDSLIALAHSLGLEVVAEGVETYHQYKQLYGIDCDYIQGYYFSKPLEAEEIRETFNKNYVFNC